MIPGAPDRRDTCLLLLFRMPADARHPTAAAASHGLKTRPRYEAVMALVYPAAAAVVERLSATRAEPWHVVVTHSVIGAVAALLIAGESRAALLVAALLLQVKTVLDNADGGLARATGRVTELGRYLDTGLDLVVNALLFVALAQHGPWPLALLAFVILTVVLSYDFNAEKLHREAHAEDVNEAAGGDGDSSPVSGTAAATGAAVSPVVRPSPALLLFRGLYAVLLAPQDRAIRRLDAELFRLATGVEYASAPTAARRAWSNAASTGALVNLGLSTQYVVLGVCAALGAPFAYVYIVVAQGIYLVAVQATRVALARRRRTAPA